MGACLARPTTAPGARSRRDTDSAGVSFWIIPPGVGGRGRWVPLSSPQASTMTAARHEVHSEILPSFRSYFAAFQTTTGVVHERCGIFAYQGRGVSGKSAPDERSAPRAAPS